MKLVHIIGISLMILSLVYVGSHFNGGLTLGGLASLEVLAFGMDFISNKLKNK